jgi:hypothetical protein
MRTTLVQTLIATVLTLLVASSAHAALIATSGAVTVITPPANATFNTGVTPPESNTTTYVWPEFSGPLPINMPTDIPAGPGFYNSSASLISGLLPAGTLVNAHFVHIDQLTAGSAVLSGQLQFDTPILGIQVRSTNAGDILNAATTYPTGLIARAPDWFAGSPPETFTIDATGTILNYTITSSNFGDQIRVFTSAQQNAQPCGIVCKVTWDAPCCFDPAIGLSTASAVLTICNTCPDDRMVAFNIVPQIAGLLTFTPSIGNILIPANSCIDIPISIVCSPNLPNPGGALFDVFITDLATGITNTCTGSVRNSGLIKVVPTNPVVSVNPVTGTDFDFLVSNTTSQPITKTFFFDVMPAGAATLPFNQVTLTVPPDGILIGLLLPAVQTVRSASRAPTFDVFFDVIVSWDQDGDGTPEVGSSIGGRVIPVCAGDLNGDGTTDGADLGLLLGGWGPCP